MKATDINTNKLHDMVLRCKSENANYHQLATEVSSLGSVIRQDEENLARLEEAQRIRRPITSNPPPGVNLVGDLSMRPIDYSSQINAHKAQILEKKENMGRAESRRDAVAIANQMSMGLLDSIKRALKTHGIELQMLESYR